MELSPEQARALGLRAVDSLVELHQVDVGGGRARRPRQGRRLRRAAGRRLVRALPAGAHGERPGLRAGHGLAGRERSPDDVATCLIHNDFRLDNLVLDDDLRVVGVLDWEMATLGDPLMDLGGALAYWVQADDDEMMRMSKRQPTDLPGMPTRAEVRRALRRAHRAARSTTGRSTRSSGCSGWPASRSRSTTASTTGRRRNPAFKDFWFFVSYLETRCRTIAGIA